MAEVDAAALRRAKLKAALSGKPLAPEITSDEVDTEAPSKQEREQEYKANRPPHYE